MLAPDGDLIEIDEMLRTAAAAVMKMPKLETMEIWNGKQGLAMVFRYQSARGRPAVITCRGTWEFDLRPATLQAWEAVAMKRYGLGTVVSKELLDIGHIIKSHGDAIHHLKLLVSVVRPVSLWQIQREHAFDKEHINEKRSRIPFFLQPSFQ